MHRRFVHALAWILATLAAVTVSWFGVRVVLDSTSDRPHTVPLSAAEGPSSSAAPTPSSSAASGSSEEERGPSSSVGAPTDRPSPSSRTSERPPRSAAEPGGPGAGGGDAAQKAAGGEVKTYAVSGGRATFEMGEDDAELVSATPEAGWQMQTWEQTTWIRVDFIRGDQRASVFCSWHDHPPRVETNEYAQ